MRGLLQRLSALLRDPARRGLLGALLVFTGMALVNLTILPWDHAPDEPRNAAYGFELWSGRLPTVNDPLPHEAMHTRPLAKSDFHASAQHPPLYYALTGAPIKASVALFDTPMPGLYLARLMTAALGLAALVMLHRLVSLLLPGRRAIAIAATFFFAALPQVVNVFSIVYNDALGTLTTLGVLHASIEVLRQGATRRRLLIAAGWMVLASLSRFSGMVASSIGLLAIGLSALLEAGGGPPLRRVGRALLRVAAPASAVAVLAGWFYARNYLLYGDVTGARELFDILDRPKHGRLERLLVDPDIWMTFHDQLWRRLAGGPRLLEGTMTVSRCFSAVAIACAIVSAVRLWRSGWARRVDRAGIATIGLVVLFFFATLVPPIAFHASGGTLMVRYCLPAIWVACLVGAIGFSCVRSAMLLQVAMVLLGILCIQIFECYAIDLLGGIKGSEFGIALAIGRAGVPVPQAFFALYVALSGAGIALAASAVGELGLRIDEPVPVLEAPSDLPAPEAPEHAAPALAIQTGGSTGVPAGTEVGGGRSCQATAPIRI